MNPDRATAARSPITSVTSAPCSARTSPRSTTCSGRASARSSSGDRAPRPRVGGRRHRRPASCSPTAGAARLPRHGRPRGVRRRRRRRLPLQPGHRRGDPAAGVGGAGPRHHAAQRHLPAVLPRATAPTSRRRAGCPASRPASSITAIAMTEPGIGSDLASMTHDRDPRRRPLRRQRLEDVHHQRHQRRPRDHRGEDRPDPAPPGHDPARRSSAAWTASSAAATSTRSACTPRTPPSCSSPTSACPVANLLGEEGEGFLHLVDNLPQERLSIAVAGVAAAPGRARAGRSSTCKERKAFGQPIGSFQNSRFVLAEMRHRDRDRARPSSTSACVALNDGELTAEEAADGEVVVHRAAEARRRPLPAAARRLRLHDRVPDRPGLRRRPHHHASTAAPPRS